MSVVSSKLVDALAKENVDQEFLDLLEAELRKIRVPVGAIMPYRGTTPPEGWLIVNGQNVYESVYPDLYNFLKAQPNAKTGTDSTGAYVKCELPHHRVIELTTNVSEVGQLVGAGLPDITDNLGATSATGTPATAQGAFKWTQVLNGRRVVTDPSAPVEYDPSFQASRSNAIYSGSSFQPKALRLLAIVKH